MEPIIAVVFVAGIIATIVLPPVLTRRQSFREKIEAMDGRKLIQTSLRAGLLKGKLRLAAYIIPVPLLVIIRCLEVEGLRSVVVSAGLVVIFGCLSAAQFFGEIEKMATKKTEEKDQ
jgi:hypothetical protein